MSGNGRAAVFLDRDGTLIDENGYVNHIDRVRHLPAIAEAVKRLRDAGFLAVLVTNQSGVARRLFDRALVDRVHELLQERMRASGTQIDAFYVCPHHPDGADPEYRLVCECRKPKPGMILKAAEDLHVDLSRSYMVGDTLGDVEAANRAGVTSVLVLTGYGRGEVRYRLPWKGVRPSHVAENLQEAAAWILSREGTAAPGGGRSA